MKGGVWSEAKRAEYGAYLKELRRMEGLTDGLRLERDEFDEYLRVRREEDAKWRGRRTVESPVARRPWDSVEHGVRVLTAEDAKVVDENRRLRQMLREQGINPDKALDTVV